MKSFVAISLILLSLQVTLAQTNGGNIEYERRQYWTKMYAELPYLTKDEIEREKATWGKDDEWKTKMKLTFNTDESLYTYLNEMGESEDGTYTWRQDEFKLYRNFAQQRKTDILETLGKTYIIEDSLELPQWKILNELKEVAGYVCMKAVTEDTLKKQKITAWFAQDLPASVGPEKYWGLPGAILEITINGGTVVVEATKVTLNPGTTTTAQAPAAKIELNKGKKLKGKRINNHEYNALIYSHIKNSMKAQRNPFWSIRY